MYRHKQPGTLIVWSLGAGVLWVAVMGFITAWHPIVILACLLLVVALWLFRSLTVEVDRNELRCFFGDGLIRRRFVLADIADVQPVRNKWWYGWGIRLTPSGWMFNVSGLDAVELTLVSGKRFRIGTNRPRDVVEAVARMRGV